MSKIGRVYKCYMRDMPTDLYIGSTTQNLLTRLQDHKNAFKKMPHKKNNWFEYLRSQNLSLLRIELLEEVKMNNKQDLLMVEDRYIRELKPKFNMHRAHLTNEEKRIQANKRKAKFRQTPKGKTYTKVFDAKPENKLKAKLRIQKNIDEKKYECMICGLVAQSPCGLVRHFNAKKHKNNITAQAINELEQLTEQNLFN